MVWPTVCRACNNQNGISLLSCIPIPQKSAGCPACPPPPLAASQAPDVFVLCPFIQVSFSPSLSLFLSFANSPSCNPARYRIFRDPPVSLQYLYSTLFRSHVPYYSENRKPFMFTPPPSPLPSTVTSFHVSTPPVQSSSPSPPSTPQQFLIPGPALSLPLPKHNPRRRRLETSTTTRDRKRRIAWCTGLMVILVPLMLVLITFLKRFASHPLFLDLLAGPHPGSRVLLTTKTDGGGHLARARHRRQTGAITMSSAVASTSGTDIVFPSVAAPTSTPVPSQTLPTIPSSPPVLPTPFPQPFDTTMGNNFTTNSCDTFFTNMTQSLPFRQCRPFSFLSQTSSAFLQVSGILTPSAIHLYADIDASLL